jgi:adenylate cyclase
MRKTKLTLLAIDLAGYTRATAGLDDIVVAAFMNDWYRLCAQAIRARGGRVVKFMGDGCLATFPADAAAAAVAAAEALAQSIEPVRDKHGLTVEVGANVHVATVAEGDFGPDDDRRYDVLGSAVNDLFRMGGAAGIRVSEAARVVLKPT